MSSHLGVLPHRFWTKVEKTPTCWLWQGAKDSRGYGSFYFNGSVKSTHRLVYETLVDSISIGLYVLHICDNPACVNPDHLFLGTQKDNVQDCLSKGRRSIQKGENNNFSILNEELVRTIRRLRNNKLTLAEIANTLNINLNTIRNVVYGKTWAHIE